MRIYQRFIACVLVSCLFLDPATSAAFAGGFEPRRTAAQQTAPFESQALTLLLSACLFAGVLQRDHPQAYLQATSSIRAYSSKKRKKGEGDVNPLPQSVSAKEAADLSDVDVRTIYNRIYDGYLRTIPVEIGPVRILVESLHLPELAASFSISQAKELLGVTRKTIYNRITAGKLKVIHMPWGEPRILKESLSKRNGGHPWAALQTIAENFPGRQFTLAELSTLRMYTPRTVQREMESLENYGLALAIGTKTWRLVNPLDELTTDELKAWLLQLTQALPLFGGIPTLKRAAEPMQDLLQKIRSIVIQELERLKQARGATIIPQDPELARQALDNIDKLLGESAETLGNLDPAGPDAPTEKPSLSKDPFEGPGGDSALGEPAWKLATALRFLNENKKQGAIILLEEARNTCLQVVHGLDSDSYLLPAAQRLLHTIESNLSRIKPAALPIPLDHESAAYNRLANTLADYLVRALPQGGRVIVGGLAGIGKTTFSGILQSQLMARHHIVTLLHLDEGMLDFSFRQEIERDLAGRGAIVTDEPRHLYNPAKTKQLVDEMMARQKPGAIDIVDSEFALDFGAVRDITAPRVVIHVVGSKKRARKQFEQRSWKKYPAPAFMQNRMKFYDLVTAPSQKRYAKEFADQFDVYVILPDSPDRWTVKIKARATALHGSHPQESRPAPARMSREERFYRAIGIPAAQRFQLFVLHTICRYGSDTDPLLRMKPSTVDEYPGIAGYSMLMVMITWLTSLAAIPLSIMNFGYDPLALAIIGAIAIDRSVAVLVQRFNLLRLERSFETKRRLAQRTATHDLIVPNKQIPVSEVERPYHRSGVTTVRDGKLVVGRMLDGQLPVGSRDRSIYGQYILRSVETQLADLSSDEYSNVFKPVFVWFYPEQDADYVRQVSQSIHEAAPTLAMMLVSHPIGWPVLEATQGGFSVFPDFKHPLITWKFLDMVPDGSVLFLSHEDVYRMSLSAALRKTPMQRLLQRLRLLQSWILPLVGTVGLGLLMHWSKLEGPALAFLAPAFFVRKPLFKQSATSEKTFDSIHQLAKAA